MSKRRKKEMPPDDVRRFEQSISIDIHLSGDGRSFAQLIGDVLDFVLKRNAPTPRVTVDEPVSLLATPAPALTRREREIARLIASGLRNEDIAAQLVLELNTVKSHRASIYKKLNVHNIAQLRDKRESYAES